MRRFVCGMVVALMVMAGMVLVAQAATEGDAKAMVEKAVVFWKANGKDKAIAEFNNPKGQFVKGDLYIHAHDFNGILIANGGNTKIVGMNFLDIKDASGKFFVKEQMEVAKTKGSGWVSYMWTNPATKKVQQKMAWVQRVEGENVFIGCGFWK